MSDLSSPAASTWNRLSHGAVRMFHSYANWLVSISWKRFLALSVLLLILTSIVQRLPPFRWTVSEVLEDMPSLQIPVPPRPPGA